MPVHEIKIYSRAEAYIPATQIFCAEADVTNLYSVFSFGTMRP